MDIIHLIYVWSLHILICISAPDFKLGRFLSVKYLQWQLALKSWRTNILYRIKNRAVAASPMRGRGRVRIKSRDQHVRDLATLGPGVPLGHPTMRTSPCVTIQVARHDARLGAEWTAHKSNYVKMQGEISAYPPPFSFSSTCFEDYRKLGPTHTCCQLYLFLYA